MVLAWKKNEEELKRTHELLWGQELAWSRFTIFIPEDKTKQLLVIGLLNVNALNKIQMHKFMPTKSTLSNLIYYLPVHINFNVFVTK